RVRLPPSDARERNVRAQPHLARLCHRNEMAFVGAGRRNSQFAEDRDSVRVINRNSENPTVAPIKEESGRSGQGKAPKGAIVESSLRGQALMAVPQSRLRRRGGGEACGFRS